MAAASVHASTADLTYRGLAPFERGSLADKICENLRLALIHLVQVIGVISRSAHGLDHLSKCDVADVSPSDVCHQAGR